MMAARLVGLSPLLTAVVVGDVSVVFSVFVADSRLDMVRKG